MKDDQNAQLQALSEMLDRLESEIYPAMLRREKESLRVLRFFLENDEKNQISEEYLARLQKAPAKETDSK